MTFIQPIIQLEMEMESTSVTNYEFEKYVCSKETLKQTKIDIAIS